MMQRRQCLRRLGQLAGGLQLMAWGAVVLPSHARGAAAPWQESRVLMGTRIDLSVCAVPQSLARSAMARAWDRMTALAALMSRFEAGNPLDQLAVQAGRGQVLPLPRELAEVMQAALQRAQDSGGHYDPTVGSYQGWDFRPGQEHRPGEGELQAQRSLSGWRHLKLDISRQQASLDRAGVRLDLGGAAKLPILEAGLAVLRQEGVAHALLNGGGDILSLGQAEADRPWRVALRDPRQPSRWLGVIDMPVAGAVLAASGDYERCFERQGRRFHHILDPRSGEPSQGLHGLALLGRSVAELNAWGPAMMVAGPAQARRWAQGLQGVELMLAGPGEGQGSQQLWMSTGLGRQLQRA
ncbi:FAD:protein FMN transferase [Mitsuaria sp. WAJ17]|uniref:FAD:protein FMN transferase n=1 Tax=Mitsuaria sp. WAJ17 TaxID=2761452 RepID=UPI0015FFB062|nr:FAD:protein FMN transferase [Mitsuaria sp. WAJ17]MBB2485930.1 FAD:protein FMN transferase [Mitsuaria sp. WAJ17]